MKSWWKEHLVYGEWVSSSSLPPFVVHIIQNYLRYFFFSLKREDSVSVKLVTPRYVCIYNVYGSDVPGLGVLWPPPPLCNCFHIQELKKRNFENIHSS